MQTYTKPETMWRLPIKISIQENNSLSALTLCSQRKIQTKTALFDLCLFLSTKKGWNVNELRRQTQKYKSNMVLRKHIDENRKRY